MSWGHELHLVTARPRSPLEQHEPSKDPTTLLVKLLNRAVAATACTSRGIKIVRRVEEPNTHVGGPSVNVRVLKMIKSSAMNAGNVASFGFQS